MYEIRTIITAMKTRDNAPRAPPRGPFEAVCGKGTAEIF